VWVFDVLPIMIESTAQTVINEVAGQAEVLMVVEV
jgi:hypothetical protein